ncbi:MAG: GNAT family N-acetyltransferase [Burkholderiaceae bacterium]|nr:GNAT family N-acetyltransferase [Burkholderiaceae bacterium]
MFSRLTRSELRKLVESRAAELDALHNPFATAAWVLHYIDHVAPDDGHFWAADVEGRALMLLQAEAAAPTQARALNNYYSSLFTPYAGALQEGDARRLTRELANARPALATVDLSPMSGDDAALAAAAFVSAGWKTRRYTSFGNWYLPCEGLSFDAYMSARPSQTVNTWTRKAKKFKPGGDTRLQLVTDPSEVAAAMRAYGMVYSKSWKQPEPYPGFIPGWAAVCAARGWLRLGIAWAGEVPIAAQFWFTKNRRAYIYKLAYDESFAKLSAGTVLSAHMFRHALDVDCVAEIDYLTGDDPYKQAWVTHRRERVGVIACNPRTFKGATRAVYEAVGALRQRVRNRLSVADRGSAAVERFPRADHRSESRSHAQSSIDTCTLSGAGK